MDHEPILKLDLVEMIRTSDEMRKQLLKYKQADPEIFDALDRISRCIFKNYVRHTMTTGQFICFTGILSLQAAEMFIREQATIECKKQDAKQV